MTERCQQDKNNTPPHAIVIMFGSRFSGEVLLVLGTFVVPTRLCLTQTQPSATTSLRTGVKQISAYFLQPLSDKSVQAIVTLAFCLPAFPNGPSLGPRHRRKSAAPSALPCLAQELLLGTHLENLSQNGYWFSFLHNHIVPNNFRSIYNFRGPPDDGPPCVRNSF